MLNRLYKSVLFKPVYFLIQIFFSISENFISYKFKNAINPTLSISTLREYNRNRLKGPKKIICNAPFTQMYFKQDGRLTACCASDAYGNINTGSIKEIWTGEKANILRNKIINYNLSGGCAGCQHSIKQKNYNAFIGRIYDTLFPVKFKSYPIEMTFDISNTCNLECIMCTGEFSDLIRKNREKLPPVPGYYDDTFFDQIISFLPKLKKVRFMGGEPFLIKQYQLILNYLLVHNKNCKIYIQTNGTILNENVKKIVESNNVELSLSIDSLNKETYEMIRKNASFDRMVENLKYFSKRAKTFGQLININFCIMNNNWKEVPDMISFCENNNFTLAIIPVINPLNLSILSLDQHKINEIYLFTKENLHRIKNTRLLMVYNDYLNFLNSHLTSSKIAAKRVDDLLLMTQEQLYEIANTLFITVNHLSFKSEEAKVFEFVIDKYRKFHVEQYKELLCDFIIHLEQLDKEETKKENLNYNDLYRKSENFINNLFQQVKK